MPDFRNNNQSRGYTPNNPPKVIAENKEQKSKYDFDDLLKDDSLACVKIEALMEICEILQLIPEKINSPEDLLGLLKERDSYRKLIEVSPERKIERLILSERPQNKNLRDSLPKSFRNMIAEIKDLETAEALLKEELNKVKLDYEVEVQKPEISEEMRFVIRSEFNGCVRQPEEGKLSEDYRQFIRANVRQEGQYRPEDYDFKEASEMWSKFTMFQSFANIEDDFKVAFAAQNISPELMKKMSAFDFMDALFKHKAAKMEKETGRTNIGSVRMFEGSREFFVKTFARNHGQEFKDSLRFMKVKPDVIENAYKAMLERGKIIPIEMGDGRLMIATVHHECAIHDAGQKENPALVNDMDNLRMMYEVIDRQKYNETVLDNSRAQIQLSGVNINLGRDVDIDKLARNPEEQKDFIKNMAASHLNELVDNFRKLGMSEADIVTIGMTMIKEGQIPVVPVGNNKFLAAELKTDAEGVKLKMSTLESVNNKAPDVHRGISHGLSARPVWVEQNLDNQPMEIRPVDYDSSGEGPSKEAYAKEVVSPLKQRIKIIKRVVSKGVKVLINGKMQNLKPACYLGGFSCIYMSPKDYEAMDNRFNRPKKYQSHTKSVERN